MADLKRGTPVRVSFEGKVVAKPLKTLPFLIRVSVDTKVGKFWAVVPTQFVKPIEEES